MKKRIRLFAAILFCVSTIYADEYRRFTDTQDRTIWGKVLRYDDAKETVTIERKNRKKATVPLDTFVAGDQAYVKEWARAGNFMSKLNFTIEAHRTVSTRTERSGSVEKDIDDVAYEVVFENRSDSSFKNIGVDYCIYSVQSKKEDVHRGTFEIKTLPARSEKTMMTDVVSVYDTELDGNYYYIGGQSSSQRGKVKGIWVRAYIKSASGEKFYREYDLPTGIGSKGH